MSGRGRGAPFRLDAPGAAQELSWILDGQRRRWAPDPVVTELSPERSRLADAKTLTDVFAGIDPLYDKGSDLRPSGSIGIQKYVGHAGATRWLVTVPGTENETGAIRGWPQNLEIMSPDASRRAEVESVEVVLEAMRRAGIAPDEEVMIAGHSQGGLIGAVIAGMPDSGFSVSRRALAGAPTAGHPIPQGVETTSLDVVGELVDALDGRPNRPSPSHVLVQGAAEPGGGGSMMPHDMDSHLAVLTRGLERGDVGLARQDREVAEFLSGRMVESRVFEGHPVPASTGTRR